MRSKVALLANKINKYERQNKAVVLVCGQGHEPDMFWKHMGCSRPRWDEIKPAEPERLKVSVT